MKALVLRFFVAFTAFFFGLSSVYLWFLTRPRPRVSEQPIVSLPNSSEAVTSRLEQSDQSPSSVFGCKDPAVDSIWGNLDLEKIRKLKRKEIWVFNLHPDFTQYPSKEQYKSNIAEFESKNLDCSIFGFVGESTDVDADGTAERFVVGQIVSNRADGETYLFRNIAGRWTPILFDKGSIESRVLNTKTHGHRDLEFKTNWSGGGRLTTVYKFDGHVYRPAKCFSEEHLVPRNGEMVQVDTPVLETTTCNPLDNLL